MRRRHFLATMATGATIATDARLLPGGDGRRVPRLMLAPHLDMFRHLAGDNLTEQMAFLHETGFRAVDDSRLTSRDVEAQVEIGQAARRYGITVGQFEGVVSFGEPLFASGRSCDWHQVLNDLQTAVRVGQRAAAGFCTVVPGVVDHRLSWARQFQNARNLLDECSQLCASAGLTLLLEPLRHPSRRRRMLIEDVHTACLMCASLARSSCRAVLDTCCRRMRPVRDLLGGPLARQVGYVQLGDFPGRKEPGTGTMDLRSLMSAIAGSGYVGLLGLEHGCSLPGARGEQSTIQVYRQWVPTLMASAAPLINSAGP